jgi:hypothetical protein
VACMQQKILLHNRAWITGIRIIQEVRSLLLLNAATAGSVCVSMYDRQCLCATVSVCKYVLQTLFRNKKKKDGQTKEMGLAACCCVASPPFTFGCPTPMPPPLPAPCPTPAAFALHLPPPFRQALCYHGKLRRSLTFLLCMAVVSPTILQMPSWG